MLLSSLDRHVLASWTNRAFKRHTNAPRIAVVGNCQSFGVAYAMRLLDLEAEIDRFPVISKSWTDIKMLGRTLATYDYVFCQEFAPGYVRGGASDALRQVFQAGTWFPSLVFGAYHPDLVLVTDPTKNNRLLYCPTGPYHSGLALFAYRAGFSVEGALRLFDREVFEALGYFEMWNGAAAGLLDQGRHFSMDLGGDFLRWARRGCFMYSINHPKPHVLYDIARHLLRAIGRPSDPIDFDTYAVDDIVRGYVFPIYPEVGDFYGIPGSYIFKTSHYQLSKNLGEFWDLRRYVQDCYRLYARQAPGQLGNDRVQGWLDDAATSKLLRDYAGESGRRLSSAA